MNKQSRIYLWAKKIKQEIVTIWLISRDRRTPWFIKGMALFTAAYAFSPIDLIPDFIPILGYLDDLIILPVMIILILKFTPPEIIEECREQAKEILVRPRSVGMAIGIVLFWIVAITTVTMTIFHTVSH